MKKSIIFFFLFVPILSLAQASGGQITRPNQNNSARIVRHSTIKQKKYIPQNMEFNIYYLCIARTEYIENGQYGQNLCQEMAAKGYSPELVKSPDENSCYVCVKKTTSTTSAREFIKSYKDSGNGIKYIFYNMEPFEIVIDDPIPIYKLSLFNVVLASFSTLSEAQDFCGKARLNALSVDIFYDASANKYRVINLKTISEKEATDRINLKIIQINYPGAWIMQVRNGQAVKYSK